MYFQSTKSLVFSTLASTKHVVYDWLQDGSGWLRKKENNVTEYYMFTYVYIDIYIYLIWLWYTLLYLYMCTHVIYFLPSPSSEDFWTSLKSLCQSSPLDLPISALIQATVPSGGLGLPERVAGTGMKQLPWGLTSSYWKILWMSHHPFLSMNFFLWFSHHLFLMLPNNTTKRQMSSCSVPFLCFLGCLANKKCGSWNPRTETDRKQLRSRAVGSHSGCPSST